MHAELEQRFAALRYDLAALTGIQNDAHISNALLLEFIDEIFLMVPGAGPPVDPAQRIALLIFAHAKKLHS